MLQKFNDVTNDVLGNISSRRFRKEYFVKHKYEYLWDWFETQKLLFPNYTNREILILLNHNCTEPPKCVVCGKNAKVQTYEQPITFLYCSQTCAGASSIRIDKLKKAKNSYTDEQKQAIETKRTSTCLEKYGVPYNSQRPEIRSYVGNLRTKSTVIDAIDNINDPKWLYDQYTEQNKTIRQIAIEQDVDYTTLHRKFKKFGFVIRKGVNRSYEEIQLHEFVKENIELEVKSSHKLEEFELDIYIKDINFAIEYNGLFWHSSKDYSSKYRHIFKTRLAQKYNIRLMHVNSYIWKYKTNATKNMILKALNKFPQKTLNNVEILEVSQEDSNTFLEINSVKHNLKYSFAYGIIYNNELVSLMLFDYKGNKVKLVEHCDITNTNYTNSFSLLINYYKKLHTESLFTFMDLSVENNKIYENNGFKYVTTTLPVKYRTDTEVFLAPIDMAKRVLNYYDCGHILYEMNP